ncbi:MAG: hypothetical protein GX817_01775 [Elusimicrobia bacterium]|nr:hypothetical protein [Elusimicrobiota bacterium]
MNRAQKYPDNPSVNIGRKLIKCFALIVLLFLATLSSSLLAADVRVIMSRDLPPYREAYKGIEKTLGRIANISVYQMHGDLRKGREAFSPLPGGQRPLFIVIGTEAAEAAATFSGKDPVVFTMVLDPSGFIAENLTGVTLEIPDRKHLEIFQKELSGINRVGIIYTAEDKTTSLRGIRIAAAVLGLEVVSAPVNSINEVPQALREISRSTDIIWLIPDAILSDPGTRNHILQFTTVNRLPVWGISEHYVKRGALGALASDYYDIGVQTAEIARRLIAGASPNEIGVETPGKIVVLLNRNAAEISGVQFSDDILREAEFVQ